MTTTLVELKNLVKVYPPSTMALNNVSIDVQKGEILSVIGENGAGKSTLMKVLYGINDLNSGKIIYKGKETIFKNPRDAVKAGVGMVHQEFMLIPSYSIYENVILGNESTRRFGALNRKKDRDAVQEVADKFELNLDVSQKVSDLSVSAQQKVEILKLLYREVDILILDEPTAVLTPSEIKQLFERLKSLRDMGKTVVFISHKLDEVLELSDRIAVMRKGELIDTFMCNSQLTKADLARAMVGRDVIFSIEKGESNPECEVLSVKKLKYTDKFGKQKLNDVQFNIRAGEIVGLAGVEGNGQFELVQAITGQISTEGEVILHGKDIGSETIRERRTKISFIPQDRKISGSSQESNLIDNMVMTHHYTNQELVGGSKYFLDKKKCFEFTDKHMKNYGVAAEGPYTKIGSLSGGNQQKVIIAREFELNNKLTILDQPTRGLDVGSIEYIQKRIIELRDSGGACFLISADLDELFSLSDRILVIYEGKIVADLNPKVITKEEIGEYMLGTKGVNV